MDLGATLGVGAGVLGLVIGLGVPLAMWRGTVSRWVAIRPEAGRYASCDEATLRARLLALDDSQQPFRYAAEPNGTIAAEWRIADAAWTQFFGRFQAVEHYRATLAFSPEHSEVRVLEQRSGSRTGPGEYTTNSFQGIVLFERSRHREWALTGNAPIDPREVLSYDFDVRRVKGPLIDATRECGWTWVPVVFRSHLTAGRKLS
ncbi:MAG: hypothetical protein A3H29_02950 [Acidobacteria bacterium RIFCSPLOWO2_02_FULL_67_21]|nr:MAG: hypothetical protein A3H29_02950 [Acidobacteria bacterium RIFCSPLOWO2_02_FULL_67_21]